ncbi:MAG: Uma2 family endonuclease [Pirellulaceae bacterium]
MISKHKMDPLEILIEPLRHSPLLPAAVKRLQTQIADESARRNQFYRDMTPEQKTEFVDGEIILHSPARNRHLEVTMMVAKLLDTFAGIHQLGVVRVEKCLCVFPRNDYEPDIVFFGSAKAEALDASTLKFPVPDLIVEVLSDSTEKNDRGVKFEDYAANGVAEYWIIDAERSTLEQYLLRDEIYYLEQKSSSGTLTSRVITGFQVAIESMFDQQANVAALRSMLAGSE